ncbi:hypothetical protein [Microcystis aeruginosa]|nr:hypothetical protein [Microcystis aeruginosa]
MAKGSALQYARSFCYSDFPDRRPTRRLMTPNPTSQLFQQALDILIPFF